MKYRNDCSSVLIEFNNVCFGDRIDNENRLELGRIANIKLGVNYSLLNLNFE